MSEMEVMYRPPFEAQSFLLEVTKGCSHNACTFCTMYRNVPFRVLPEDVVRAQLIEAEPWAARIKRVFLENGDPFALSADRLLRISEMVHQHLPAVDTISMYASIKNIQGKTDNELLALREAGINELNIGIESGLDSVLERMNKGYTADQAKTELQRLRKAGIDWGANIIFGCAGAGHAEENATATAELLNDTWPILIFTGTIHADAGCPLYDDLQSGCFEEPSIGEYLEEEEKLLSLLDLENCLYFGMHPSNVAPMHGWLNWDRFDLLREVDNARERYLQHLNDRPVRGGEGAIIPWRE